MAYAAVRGARSRPAAPARRDDGVDVASRDRVLAVAVAAGLRAVGRCGARTVPEDALRPGSGGRRGLVLVADDAGSLPGPPLLAVLRRPGPVVVVGGAVAADRLLVAARAGRPGRRRGAAVRRPGADGRPHARGDVRAGDALLVDQLVGVVRDRRAVASLTGRETEVLEHLAGGRSVAEIAAALVLSVATVRAHVRSILRKLGVSSQLAASAALARARGGRPVRR